MKILVIMSAGNLACVDGTYYRNNGITQLYRYKPFGSITLCCCITDHADTREIVDLSDVRIRPINKINTIKSLFSKRIENKRIITEEVAKADAVIAYVPSDEGYYARAEAEKRGIPCLFVAIGCPWDAYWNHGVKGKLLAPIAFFKMKINMKRAQHIIYVTQEFLQRRYPTNGKSVGVSNVIIREINDINLQNRIEKINQTNFEKGHEIKIATCAGIDVKYKGQDDVIKAISELKGEYNIHYYVAGPGNKIYLEEVAKKCGVSDRIHFLGNLTYNEVLNLQSTVDIYIQPSKQEGLPRAVIEAMSMATPCIGSNTAGIPELLPSECIFKRGNITDIVRHIRSLLNRQSLIEMAKSNFEKAKEYSFDVLEKRRNEFLSDFFQ